MRKFTAVAARAAVVLLAVGLGAVEVGAEEGDGTEVIDGLEVLQLQGAIKEGNEAHWVARLDKRPLQTGMEGYRPRSGLPASQPTTWEPAVEFFWNFGDGTGWISTGERPSVGHRYMEMGEYVLQVEARSEAGTVGGELEVEVEDRRYYNPLILAIEVEPATSTWELTADVFNPSRDEVTVRWDLGDGETKEGPDLWRVRHTFSTGGPREVTIVWTGDDGTETSKTRTWEADAGSDALDQFDAEVVAEGVGSRFEGSWSGGLPAGVMRAEVRPFANLFLGPVADGECRFLLTAWDPKLLLRVHLLADLPKLSPDRGRYRVSTPRFTLFADESSEAYVNEYRNTGFNEKLGSLLGGVDFQGVTQGRVNQELRALDGGVQMGPREEQEVDGSAPVSASPLVSESEHFTGTGGAIELAVTPHQRVVGLVDLSLQGGTYEDRKACRGNWYAEGRCKTLRFQGRFALDLRSASRDGLVRYGGCLDSDFAVRGVYGPEPGERHVSTRRPRIGVRFSSDVDPETLDASTLELTYPDREGRPVPVEARILRDHDAATLKPVEELWGGVKYTARVKTGEVGVRGLNGTPLEDEDGSGWKQLREFWSRLDFVPDGESGQNVSCHVYQGVRDAPLVAGKPAAARIYADWKENPEVHPDAQLATLPARVVLQQTSADGTTELARVEHEFVRPDAAGSATASGEEAALLRFVPNRETPSVLGVTLELDRRTESNTWYPLHRTVCSTPVWKHEPTLRLVYYALDFFDDPSEEDVYARVLRYEEPFGLEYVAIKHLFPVKQEVTWSVIPFEDIWLQEEYPDLLETPRDLRDWEGTHFREWAEDQSEQWSALVAAAWSALLDARAAEGDDAADLVVGLVPYFAPIGYASTTPVAFYKEHPGVLMLFLGPDDRADSLLRAAGAVLHMTGHFLGLEDAPPGGFEPPQSFDLPFAVHDFGVAPDWHDGVEMAQCIEDEWRFFSSKDIDSLMPVMGSHVANEPVYILRHHYLAVQQAIDEHPGILRP